MSFYSHTRKKQPNWSDYLAQRANAAKGPCLERFFAQSALPLDMPIGEAPLVALDMETTGLDVNRHAIVSVGLVPFSLRRISLAQRRYWVVRPSRTLSEESIKFHRITHSKIAEAPDLDTILDEMLATMTGRLAVVHYRHIERPFLDSAVKARRGESLLFPVIDTMSLEARRHRQSMWARFRRWIGRPPASIRLHDSRARYGLPAYQGHHALIDALATAELLQAQVARHYSLDTPVSDFLS
ncbi:3'-5' exonuclease [Phytohalomonas tamaricis]|uniref:3'-5' exonuclease n=1 Tax=Phytohalomonas tamaricis TaxID=2081032 RepID=UPI000D0AD416|nr:3'-5' exonuclease [Phytohalomonas tamaricis]